MSSVRLKSSVVLCEGFYDRAFWYGMLQHLGCRFEREIANLSAPTNYRKAGGEYDGNTANANFVALRPIGGIKNTKRTLESVIRELPKMAWDNIVICVDSDLDATKAGTNSWAMTDIQKWVAGVSPDIETAVTADGVLELNGGSTKVFLVYWETADAPSEGIPNQQTLERLVCAAMKEVYPERADEVQKWLNTRTNPPSTAMKEFSWSYMAGWYSEVGCETFYELIWKDENLRNAIIGRLEQKVYWGIIQNVAI
jgi:hypothetical protein